MTAARMASPGSRPRRPVRGSRPNLHRRGFAQRTPAPVIPDLASERSEAESVGNPCLNAPAARRSFRKLPDGLDEEE
jgi:hypothetical protein